MNVSVCACVHEHVHMSVNVCIRAIRRLTGIQAGTPVVYTAHVYVHSHIVACLTSMPLYLLLSVYT